MSCITFNCCNTYQPKDTGESDDNCDEQLDNGTDAQNDQEMPDNRQENPTSIMGSAAVGLVGGMFKDICQQVINFIIGPIVIAIKPCDAKKTPQLDIDELPPPKPGVSIILL